MKVLICVVTTDLLQEKRFQKLANTARSISEISSQASLFIPTAMPSILPGYVTVDPKSQWHVSGLLSTALESMTLPSRLKLRDGTRETLDHLSGALNVNGNQNIAKLRMSVDHTPVPAVNGHNRPGRLEVRAQSRDPRVPSQDRAGKESDGDGLTTFDMDLFPAEIAEESRGRRTTQTAHVFGQAENYRGDEEKIKALKVIESSDEDEGFERARRRAAGLPVIQRFVHSFYILLSMQIQSLDTA